VEEAEEEEVDGGELGDGEEDEIEEEKKLNRGSDNLNEENDEEIMEEDPLAQKDDVDLSLSIIKLIDNPQPIVEIDHPVSKTVKQGIIEELANLMEEVRTTYLNISEQAVEHIFAGEVVLTYGVSQTVSAFLREAAKFRKFEVIVAESAPSYEGHRQAVRLAEAGVDTTVITDSAVYAMMRVVNKVIIGTHAVMANGGLIAHTGGHNICVAAKYHSVPVVVLTGLHKLCPLYAFDQDTFNEHNAPSQIIKFEEDLLEKVDVQNPALDYIPPELVTLYITNLGAHAPSYIYRLLAEYYNPQDYNL